MIRQDVSGRDKRWLGERERERERERVMRTRDIIDAEGFACKRFGAYRSVVDPAWYMDRPKHRLIKTSVRGKWLGKTSVGETNVDWERERERGWRYPGTHYLYKVMYMWIRNIKIRGLSETKLIQKRNGHMVTKRAKKEGVFSKNVLSDGFLLFLKAVLRNRSLSNARWCCSKKRKIRKGNGYLTENRLSRNEMWCASDNHNNMRHIRAEELLDSNFN